MKLFMNGGEWCFHPQLVEIILFVSGYITLTAVNCTSVPEEFSQKHSQSSNRFP